MPSSSRLITNYLFFMYRWLCRRSLLCILTCFASILLIMTWSKHQANEESEKASLPNICCYILTAPKHLIKRAKVVNDTWGPRCDRYFFISGKVDKNASAEEIKMAQELPIAPIPNITEGYSHLTKKSSLAFDFAYENHFSVCDWFVKADDDTYLIVEHLKAFLSEQNSSEPITFGYNFKVHVEKGYHSGGASYVLSREALRRFHSTMHDPTSPCRKDGGSEDVEIATCLRTQGVYPGRSLDKDDRELFHPLPLTHHFTGFFPGWLFKYAENPPQKGYNCCSDHSISFHYVSPQDQYLMDFLLYRARSPGPSKSGWFGRLRRLNGSKTGN